MDRPTNKEAFPWDEAPTYLIRDNDALYGSAFVRRLRAMWIRDRPIVPGSPWQNGAVERLIGSIRRECLDHVLIFSEAHLRHIEAQMARARAAEAGRDASRHSDLDAQSSRLQKCLADYAKDRVTFSGLSLWPKKSWSWRPELDKMRAIN